MSRNAIHGLGITDDLERRIATLEAIRKNRTMVTDALGHRIVALEAALSKQRAVNEALLAWFRRDEFIWDNPDPRPALIEALD